VDVELHSHPAQVGDVYVLCSDGLSGMVTDEEICEVVGQHPDDLTALCVALTALANEHGGEDNITALAVRIVADD
jgi:PPM family protein phosphatase